MSTNLKLTTHDEERERYYLEKRTSVRRRARGWAVVATDDTEHQRKIMSIELRDLSEGGLGAVCAEPIDRGTRVWICMPGNTGHPSSDLHGKVCWCRKAEDGWALGIQLEAQAHAAA